MLNSPEPVDLDMSCDTPAAAGPPDDATVVGAGCCCSSADCWKVSAVDGVDKPPLVPGRAAAAGCAAPGRLGDTATAAAPGDVAPPPHPNPDVTRPLSSCCRGVPTLANRVHRLAARSPLLARLANARAPSSPAGWPLDTAVFAVGGIGPLLRGWWRAAWTVSGRGTPPLAAAAVVVMGRVSRPPGSLDTGSATVPPNCALLCCCCCRSEGRWRTGGVRRSASSAAEAEGAADAMHATHHTRSTAAVCAVVVAEAEAAGRRRRPAAAAVPAAGIIAAAV